MNITVKDIREHAKSIKESGTVGSAAWKRLELYCKSFDNIAYNNDNLVVFIRGSYRLICGDIIKSDYFYQHIT